MLAVVLGAASDAARANEAQKLLNWGFQAFDTVQLYQSGKTISTLRVWKGTLSEVPAGFLADRYGIVVGFYVLGAFAAACAIVIALTRHWAFQRS